MNFNRFDSAGFVINWCARVFERRMAEALRPLGLAPAYLPPLLTLAATGGATQGELAKAVAIQQPTMALTLRRMERDGLVMRVPDKADQRRAIVRLTPKAEELVPRVEGLARSINEAAFEGLPDDAPAQLIDLLHRAAHNLERPEKG
ncbi:DNA-binding MarR family transcriptional regulator [Prauserella shujinwangii]|uniref:DNA-binding MarR family transcriptional regulator n=1 Tax=Prauserella shujinwangii TaxID=1453103 RepID=A0A2T0M0D8_9PSEU|nr:MarR family winged helix-turn-helix transcriptional regulator [Prauserella shujinwangii]PRX50076.1 DNA-binding MarR family transcriptional regulator [Prauserella shujinwangii]